MRILLVLLALIAAPAWAEWVEMVKGSEANVYIDPATIRKDGNMRRVWELQDLKDKGKRGEMSRRVLFEYDCKEERGRFLSYSMHSEPMANGKVIFSHDGTGEWMHVAPGSSGASILKRICAK